MGENPTFRAMYEAYLRSDGWRDLRRRVWRRCGGVCERCGREPMEHVHHLTYERVFDEHLDDLEGVCSWCHLCRHGLATWEHLSEMAKRL
jgi:5-methylcytosine-specific restriction endonuclease McrA